MNVFTNQILVLSIQNFILEKLEFSFLIQILYEMDQNLVHEHVNYHPYLHRYSK